MTDNEIIKALECCIGDDYDYCEECPMLRNKPCQEPMIEGAFHLIKRQQAEIDVLKNDTIMKLECVLKRANKYGIEADEENARLKAEIERLKYVVNTVLEKYEELYEEEFVKAKAEAVKEFAKKLKERLIAVGIYPVIVKNAIEDLIKEMEC